MGHHGLELVVVELVEEAARGGDVRFFRVAAGGESVGRIVLHYPDFGHREAGADAQVLNDTVEFRLRLLRDLLGAGHSENGGSRGVVHRDADAGGYQHGSDAYRDNGAGVGIAAGRRVVGDDRPDGGEEQRREDDKTDEQDERG